jgi:hypothetical protein
MRVIDGNIAEILDERRVALNAGANKGVVVDAPVTVWRRVFVKDPSTGESLGHVDLDALTMRVVDVGDRLSVAAVAPGRVNLFQFSFLGATKRIRTGSSADDQSVLISVGDRVTIEVSDDDASGDEDVEDLNEASAP